MDMRRFLLLICLIIGAHLNAQEVEVERLDKDTFGFSLDPAKLTLEQVSAQFEEVVNDSIIISVIAVDANGQQDGSKAGTYWIKADGLVEQLELVNGAGQLKLAHAQRDQVRLSNLNDKDLVVVPIVKQSWTQTIAMVAIVLAIGGFLIIRSRKMKDSHE